MAPHLEADDPESALTTSGLLKPLSHRPFRRLLLAQTVSRVGDGIFTVALATVIIRKDGGAALLGLALGVESTCWLLGLLACNLLISRLNDRSLMLIADGGRATALIAYLVLESVLPELSLVVLAGTIGACVGLFDPSFSAIVPRLLPSAEYQSGNAVRSSTQNLGSALGPLLGAGTVVLGTERIGFLVNAVTFLIAFLTTLTLPASRPTRSAYVSQLKSAVAGVRTILGIRWLLCVTLQSFVLIALARAPFKVLLVIVLAQVGHPEVLGPVLALQVGGSISGALLAARLRTARPGAWAAGGALAAVLPLGALAIAPNFPAIAVTATLAGIGQGILGVVATTAIQREVPLVSLGQVFSFQSLVLALPDPFSLAVTPILVGRFGIGSVAAVAVVICVGVTLTVLPARGFLRLTEHAVAKRRVLRKLGLRRWGLDDTASRQEPPPR